MMKLVLILTCLVGIQSCKYKLSAYSADTPKQKLNEFNLKLIKTYENETPANFKVAFISDTHNYFKKLDKLISKIHSRGPYSFVVICGDITNYGLLEEFDLARRFFNKLKYPYLVTVGNHDLIANGDIISRKMFGRSNFHFNYKNYQFILLDNNNWENSREAPNLPWLEDVLNSSAGDKIMVAHVSPSDRDRFSDQEISDLTQLLDATSVRYFLHGHDHNPGESTFGNAVKITVGAPSKGSYYELNFSNGGISHQKINF